MFLSVSVYLTHIIHKAQTKVFFFKTSAVRDIDVPQSLAIWKQYWYSKIHIKIQLLHSATYRVILHGDDVNIRRLYNIALNRYVFKMRRCWMWSVRAVFDLVALSSDWRFLPELPVKANKKPPRWAPAMWRERAPLTCASLRLPAIFGRSRDVSTGGGCAILKLEGEREE